MKVLDRYLYPEFSDNWDDGLFREHVLSVLDDTSRVLDVGAGAGIIEAMNFRGEALRVCGVDLDERVLENSYLDEAKVGMGEDLPYPDETFDVVIANNVLEHLEKPQEVLSEVKRVLRPGGYFLAKTPNRHHYVPQIARLTPHAFHEYFNTLRRGEKGRKADDVFPTRYLANTEPDIRRLASDVGLVVRHIHHIEGRPEYLRFSIPTYLAGWIYERVVNSVEALNKLRVIIIAVLQKEKEASAQAQ